MPKGQKSRYCKERPGCCARFALSFGARYLRKTPIPWPIFYARMATRCMLLHFVPRNVPRFAAPPGTRSPYHLHSPPAFVEFGVEVRGWSSELKFGARSAGCGRLKTGKTAGSARPSPPLHSLPSWGRSSQLDWRGRARWGELVPIRNSLRASFENAVGIHFCPFGDSLAR